MNFTTPSAALTAKQLKAQCMNALDLKSTKDAKKFIRSIVTPGRQSFAKLDMRCRDCWEFLYNWLAGEVPAVDCPAIKEDFSDITLESIEENLEMLAVIERKITTVVEKYSIDPVLHYWDTESFYAGLSAAEYMLRANNNIVSFTR